MTLAVERAEGRAAEARAGAAVREAALAEQLAAREEELQAARVGSRVCSDDGAVLGLGCREAERCQNL